MTATPGILCVGRLYCDLIFTGLPRLPTMGTEVFAGGFGVHAGGGAFITAAYLASLGHRAVLSATVPAPPFRDVVLGELERAGVDARLCGAGDPAADPQVTVALAGRSDRAFVTRRVGPAFPPLSVPIVRQTGVRHIHVGELATLIERPELIELAKACGATISLDCGWDDDVRVAQARVLIARVDVFLPNEAEYDMLVGSGAPEPLAPLTVIKQGRQGATAIRGAERVREGAEIVETVDTTGAGDAFNAGFLSRWLEDVDLASCLRAGHRQGHLAVSQRGGFSAGATQQPRAGAADPARDIAAEHR